MTAEKITIWKTILQANILSVGILSILLIPHMPISSLNMITMSDINKWIWTEVEKMFLILSVFFSFKWKVMNLVVAVAKELFMKLKMTIEPAKTLYNP